MNIKYIAVFGVGLFGLASCENDSGLPPPVISNKMQKGVNDTNIKDSRYGHESQDLQKTNLSKSKADIDTNQAGDSATKNNDQLLFHYGMFAKTQTVLAYELSDQHGYIKSPQCMNDMVTIRKLTAPKFQKLREMKITGEKRMAIIHLRNAYSYLTHCWSCSMEDRERWCSEAAWESTQADVYLTFGDKLQNMIDDKNYQLNLKGIAETF